MSALLPSRGSLPGLCNPLCHKSGIALQGFLEVGALLAFNSYHRGTKNLLRCFFLQDFLVCSLLHPPAWCKLIDSSPSHLAKS